MKIALFDFDGTITKKDSLPDFIKYAVGKRAYYYGLLFLSPILVAYKLKLTPNYIAKEKLISYYFKGWDYEHFQDIADRYPVDIIIRPKAIKKILWHKEQGHKVVIVTASLEYWLRVWCKKNGVDLLATRLEILDGKLTGKFSTKNCYGIEKVNRVKQHYKLTDYNMIYAYGDSAGDKELLTIADKQYYKIFD
jgi:HAD superfamily hydrolase (TIGR01490 family)